MNIICWTTNFFVKYKYMTIYSFAFKHLLNDSMHSPVSMVNKT